MFIPGDTVPHKIYIPFKQEELDTVVVSYKQNGHIVYQAEAEPEDDYGQSSSFIVNLTQAESLLFEENSVCFIQVNVILSDGTRLASHEMRCNLGPQHIHDLI